MASTAAVSSAPSTTTHPPRPRLAETRTLPGPDSTAAASLVAELESTLERRGRRAESVDEGLEEALLPASYGNLSRDELPFQLDRRLMALAREQGPLRAAAARVAAHLVCSRAWEALPFARLSDYAAECLGVSARTVQDLAHVGGVLSSRPLLEDALVSGRLGWTKVRLLARLPAEEDEGPWIEHARTLTALQLSKAVRAVDRRSVEAGAVDETRARSRCLCVRCSPEVRAKWSAARSVARRAAGRRLHPAEAAELVAAEVLSALPLDDRPDAGPSSGDGNEEGFSWARATEAAVDEGPSEPFRPGSMAFEREARAAAEARARRASHRRPVYPPALEPLLEGLDEADAFSLDERLQRAVSLERRLEARMGPLLAVAWPRFVHRALGYTSRDAWVKDRLGMDPARARALVRLERVVTEDDTFTRAYRSGVLSWVKASAVAPLVKANPLGWFVGEWVGWAQRVTVRRLRDDVEAALTLAETGPAAFRLQGGLPPEARKDRGIGAARMGAQKRGTRGGERDAETESEPESDNQDAEGERGIGAWCTGPGEVGPYSLTAHRFLEAPVKSAPHETCWASFIGPPDVVQLFGAVLATVRRHLERDTGRLPTEGEALDAMLEHCFEAWGARDEKVAREHRVFARDGWRCAVPGCTSMDNLHDHHIRFRSAGGSDEMENRVTVCAFHHLRGIHRGILRCVGRAPDGLRWEMGIRPNYTPRMVYRSGDIRVEPSRHPGLATGAPAA